MGKEDWVISGLCGDTADGMADKDAAGGGLTVLWKTGATLGFRPGNGSGSEVVVIRGTLPIDGVVGRA